MYRFVTNDKTETQQHILQTKQKFKQHKHTSECIMVLYLYDYEIMNSLKTANR